MTERDDGFVEAVNSFHALKERIAKENKMLNEIKGQLSTVVEEEGEVDDKGHLYYELPPGTPYTFLKRERRISKSLDEEKAEEILRAKDLYDSCTEQVTVLDQDAVLAAHYEGKLTEDELDAMFPPTITWAFVPVK